MKSIKSQGLGFKIDVNQRLCAASCCLLLRAAAAARINFCLVWLAGYTVILADWLSCLLSAPLLACCLLACSVLWLRCSVNSLAHFGLTFLALTLTITSSSSSSSFFGFGAGYLWLAFASWTPFSSSLDPSAPPSTILGPLSSRLSRFCFGKQALVLDAANSTSSHLFRIPFISSDTLTKATLKRGLAAKAISTLLRPQAQG